MRSKGIPVELGQKSDRKCVLRGDLELVKTKPQRLMTSLQWVYLQSAPWQSCLDDQLP
jgi:hypothetical protein